MSSEKLDFDLTLAKECAVAFAGSSGLGCVVSDTEGNLLAEYGYGCASCEVCSVAGREKSHCVQAQNYGMNESERFGGRYIYYCPAGLTCFVSPILGDVSSAAKITVGPFLMVDVQDYLECEMAEISAQRRENLLDLLQDIPLVTTSRVQQLSTMLFMSVGFLNKVSASNRLMESQASHLIQGQIGSYIFQLKNSDDKTPYPLATEAALLKSIREVNRSEAQRLLNELLGHILFATGRDFEQLKSRILELLTLISRASVEAGVGVEQALMLCHEGRQQITLLHNVEELCHCLSGLTDKMINSVFAYSDTRHANAIHCCTQHIETHYYQKISLEQLADMVYLSPPYLSRIFKQEVGTSFNTYLNEVRISKAKALLMHEDLRLIDISTAVGFEDQSYFTKVFRRVTGVTPMQYRAHNYTANQQ